MGSKQIKYSKRKAAFTLQNENVQMWNVSCYCTDIIQLDQAVTFWQEIITSICSETWKIVGISGAQFRQSGQEDQDHMLKMLNESDCGSIISNYSSSEVGLPSVFWHNVNGCNILTI